MMAAFAVQGMVTVDHQHLQANLGGMPFSGSPNGTTADYN
ncbi:hypothetical protein ACZ87_03235 [Candidatus Erwinia dacicola]|uniref:Uncharacterized protein n=1 Tax=Candidatus Erwinia dacicola TaxID=252393 RepID=A0A328THH3_9GAMM|nr:hypothetical protein ACZ87_03235 [Candidatus Erwinia dacicola]